MIIANGHINLLVNAGGGTDALGRPVELKAEWGSLRPCQILVNNDNRVGRYEDGVFHQASYKLYIDIAPINAKRLKLTRKGEELGEFDIISVNDLDAVQQTEIIV